MAMFNKLKQFNDLRKQANSLRAKLAEEKVTVEHKALTITMDGNQEVLEVKFNPEYLGSDKKNQLEQQVKEAVNDTIKKAQRVMATKLKDMGELNIPGLS